MRDAVKLKTLSFSTATAARMPLYKCSILIMISARNNNILFFKDSYCLGNLLP